MKEILKSVQIIESKYQHQKVIDSEIASYNLKSNYDSIFSHIKSMTHYLSKT